MKINPIGEPAVDGATVCLVRRNASGTGYFYDQLVECHHVDGELGVKSFVWFDHIADEPIDDLSFYSGWIMLPDESTIGVE